MNASFGSLLPKSLSEGDSGLMHSFGRRASASPRRNKLAFEASFENPETADFAARPPEESPRRFSLFHPSAIPPSPVSSPLPALARTASLPSPPQRSQSSERMRSVTPPPTIINKDVEEDDDGWVSISTVNMSPFMVLRIKALIELASIESLTPEDEVNVKVMANSGVRLKPCLKSSFNVCEETSRLERLRYTMDSDERCVNLLNDLLETARQTSPPVSLAQVNETYKLCYNPDSSQALANRAKLSFSEGASLLCFDSTEKPRRVKDNHRRHFAKFLSYQRSASASSSLLGVPKLPSPTQPMPSPSPPNQAPSSMPTPPGLSPPAQPMPSPSQQMAAPSSMASPPAQPMASLATPASLSPQVPSPSSGGSTQASPSPVPALKSNPSVAPRHLSPRLTEAFVSSITSNTSASAAVLASVLQTDNVRVYGHTVPPRPSLLHPNDQRQPSVSRVYRNS